jgi:SAM-dependent methyltransferase
MKKAESPIYDRNFYTRIGDWSTTSARTVIPYLMDLFHPTSVVDIGCGDGSWLKVFTDFGVEKVIGIDGAYVTPEIFKLPYDCFYPHDLTAPIKLDQKFDLALCLEVAEHLPECSANQLIDSLIQLSDVIVFSSAIPYQPGDGHINLQWPEYWITKFSQKDYILINSLKYRFWDHSDVEFFYKQNMNIFAKLSVMSQKDGLMNEHEKYRDLPTAIVTPELYSLLGSGFAKYVNDEPKFNHYARKLKHFLRLFVNDRIHTGKNIENQ